MLTYRDRIAATGIRINRRRRRKRARARRPTACRTASRASSSCLPALPTSPSHRCTGHRKVRAAECTASACSFQASRPDFSESKASPAAQRFDVGDHGVSAAMSVRCRLSATRFQHRAVAAPRTAQIRTTWPVGDGGELIERATARLSRGVGYSLTHSAYRLRMLLRVEASKCNGAQLAQLSNVGGFVMRVGSRRTISANVVRAAGVKLLAFATISPSRHRSDSSGGGARNRLPTHLLGKDSSTMVSAKVRRAQLRRAPDVKAGRKSDRPPDEI